MVPNHTSPRFDAGFTGMYSRLESAYRCIRIDHFYPLTKEGGNP